MITKIFIDLHYPFDERRRIRVSRPESYHYPWTDETWNKFPQQPCHCWPGKQHECTIPQCTRSTTMTGSTQVHICLSSRDEWCGRTQGTVPPDHLNARRHRRPLDTIDRLTLGPHLSIAIQTVPTSEDTSNRLDYCSINETGLLSHKKTAKDVIIPYLKYAVNWVTHIKVKF